MQPASTPEAAQARHAGGKVTHLVEKRRTGRRAQQQPQLAQAGLPAHRQAMGRRRRGQEQEGRTRPGKGRCIVAQFERGRGAAHCGTACDRRTIADRDRAFDRALGDPAARRRVGRPFVLSAQSQRPACVAGGKPRHLRRHGFDIGNDQRELEQRLADAGLHSAHFKRHIDMADRFSVSGQAGLQGYGECRRGRLRMRQRRDGRQSRQGAGRQAHQKRTRAPT